MDNVLSERPNESRHDGIGKCRTNRSGAKQGKQDHAAPSSCPDQVNGQCDAARKQDKRSEIKERKSSPPPRITRDPYGAACRHQKLDNKHDVTIGISG